MPRRRMKYPTVRLPPEIQFEAAAMEYRAYQGLYDAMRQHLARRESREAAETAGLLLDRIKTSRLAVSVNTVLDVLEDDAEDPEFDGMAFLKDLAGR